MNQMNLLLKRSRLALQEFGPSMALLNLPGGYLIALTGLLHRRWPIKGNPQAADDESPTKI